MTAKMTNVIRKTIAAIFAAVTVAACAASASAALYQPAGPVYNVNVDNGYLTLRSTSKCADNNKVGELYNNSQVVVLDTDCGGDYWYIYSINTGAYGYVSPDFLSYTTGIYNGRSNYEDASGNIYTIYNDDDEDSAYTDNYYTVYVENGYLALRNAPVYDYTNEIAHLYNGETVSVQLVTADRYWYVYIPT